MAGANTRPANDTPAEPSGVKLASTLGFAGLVSGLCLVLVYEATLPRIKANEAAARERAVLKVVPGASAVMKLQVTATAVQEAGADTESDVYGAYSQGGVLAGYAIVGEGPGFQDTIRLMYGFDPKRQLITGMEILDSRETPGLGDKIFKDADFVGNFRALAVKPEVVVVKNGTRDAANEVDAITGATISSKAVVRIINAANGTWLPKLSRAATADVASSLAGAPASAQQAEGSAP